jgi:hypothetical protein
MSESAEGERDYKQTPSILRREIPMSQPAITPDIAPEFRKFLIEQIEKDTRSTGGQARYDAMCKALRFVEERDGIFRDARYIEGCITTTRLRPLEAEIQAWHPLFNQIGVDETDIAEYRLTGLPQDLSEFEGYYAIKAINLTEEQYKEIIEAGADRIAERNVEHEKLEKTLLTKLRLAYNTLAEVQALVDGNEELLTRCNSYIRDAMEWQDRFDYSFLSEAPLTQALMAVHAVGGDIYAKINTPWSFEGDEPTEAELEANFELEMEYAALWVEEGEPKQASNFLQTAQPVEKE